VTYGEQIAGTLRSIRRSQKAPQEVVAKALTTTISAVSRLERGHRSLRLDYLVAWAGALGYRVDVVFWKPVRANEAWDPSDPDRPGLDTDCAEVLAEVASGVGHMPPAARHALIERVRMWKTAAADD
jgi:transcriptional regulator with XRE-family HTH domain